LRKLDESLKSIDETSPGEDADAYRAKSAAFALVSLAQTNVAFAEYVRVDKMPTDAPGRFSVAHQHGVGARIVCRLQRRCAGNAKEVAKHVGAGRRVGLRAADMLPL
jgi:hypothetical protein